jgi:hypothetical protein
MAYRREDAVKLTRITREFFKNSSVGGGGASTKRDRTILTVDRRDNRWLLVTKSLVWYRI